jgi:hypothetical protein
VLLIGHNPALQDLALELADADLNKLLVAAGGYPPNFFPAHSARSERAPLAAAAVDENATWTLSAQRRPKKFNHEPRFKSSGKNGGAAPLAKSIFADTNQVLSELSGGLGTASAARRHSLCVSEMVASFTGTVVWLGFRSALYERFAGKASTMELEECLRTATKLWQDYNELFFGFHLDFLRKRMAPVGLILVVFDTRKIYDDPERASFPAFREQFSIIEILAAKQLRVFRHAAFSWRDHPEGFDVSLHGVPVSDFQAHTHDVELYVLAAASS